MKSYKLYKVIDMIISCGLKIFNYHTGKTHIIPCTLYCDGYNQLSELGYKKDIDYKVISEGFVNSNNDFLNRAEAIIEAKKCLQFYVN